MPKGIPNKPDDDNINPQMAEALTNALGSTPAQGLDKEDLKDLVWSMIRQYQSEQSIKELRSQDAEDSELVGVIGNQTYVGVEKIKKLKHEMVTGKAPDPSVNDPAKAPLVEVHEGIFNMPWHNFTLPWTQTDERNYRAGLGTPYPRQYVVTVNGLGLRAVAGRQMSLPRPYVECLVAGGVLHSSVLPAGNDVRRWYEEDERDRLEREMRARRRWAGLMPAGATAGLTPAPGAEYGPG